MQTFGSGLHPTVLAEALRALLAPVVLLAAVAGLLLGLQRNYVGSVTSMRANTARRRAGEAGARHQFLLVYQSASLHARAISLLYASCIFLLLSSCATGTVLFLERETSHRENAALLLTISYAGLFCFLAGLLCTLSALWLLLREVPLPFRSVEEDF
jgi:hypothetical protein